MQTMTLDEAIAKADDIVEIGGIVSDNYLDTVVVEFDDGTEAEVDVSMSEPTAGRVATLFHVDNSLVTVGGFEEEDDTDGPLGFDD